MNIKNNYKPYKKVLLLGTTISLCFLGASIFLAQAAPASNPPEDNNISSTPKLVPVYGSSESIGSLQSNIQNLESLITEKQIIFPKSITPEEIQDDVLRLIQNNLTAIYFPWQWIDSFETIRKYLPTDFLTFPEKINADLKTSAKNLSNRSSCSNFPIVGSQDYEEWKAGTYQIPFLIDKNIAAGSYGIDKNAWMKLADGYEHNFYCCLPYSVK